MNIGEIACRSIYFYYVNVDFIKGDGKQDVYFVTLNVQNENIDFRSADRFVKRVEGQAVYFHLRAHCHVRAQGHTRGVDDFALAVELRELYLFTS
jgi:hypothetical protein